MNEHIADITSTMIADIKFNEVDVTRNEMLSWLNHQYGRHFAVLQYSENPGRVMARMVAMKQMVDTIQYNPSL